MRAGGLFGELYLRSTRPFLAPTVTEAELAFLAQRLGPGPILDVGCGHGRHLGGLRGAVGLDADPLSLAEARLVGPVVRGDFAALPFRASSFHGALCWYNTLGTVDEAVAAAYLGEVARCLTPGGTVILHSDHPARARAQPVASYSGTLPDGSLLEERSTYDPATGRDTIERRLTLPDGRVMGATFFIRYYEVADWQALVEPSGLTVVWACGSIDGSAVEASSRDVIVGAQKRV